MTQTDRSSNLMTLTRPGPTEALPVLISIPSLSTSGRVRRPKTRRRLRREVRVAGYALLAILPASIAFLAFAGQGFPTLAAGLSFDHRAASAEPGVLRPAVISLSPLEPVVNVQRDVDAPVILPGYLLPADTSEESSDGGH